MIKLKQLKYTYRNKSPYAKQIFANIDLNITGSKVLVLGKSGSGKSTLFKILMGDLKVNKQMIDKPRNIAIVMQNVNNQLITSTVYDELNLGYEQKYAKKLEKTQINEVFTQFGISFDLEQNPQTLSGGQKKLLLIMCITLLSPDWIIFDEPLVGLDFEHRQLVLDYISKTSTKLLISTHQIENLVQICDQMLLVDEQKIKITTEQEVRQLKIIKPKGDTCEL